MGVLCFWESESVVAMREAYVYAGCDFILGNNFDGHIDQIQAKKNAANTCWDSVKKNCF
jgi:hypothetical protein